MLARLFDFLYGNVPARFPSDFPLAESVARLRERTERSIFVTLLQEAAAGPVTESRVRLQRVIPLVGNSFKPVFAGAFRQVQGRVVLEGRFTMFLFSKILMTIWLAFALVWTGVAVFAVSRSPKLTLLFPLYGLGFVVAGIAFLRFCWWLSRNDIPYLTSVIQRALSGEPSQDPTPGPTTRRTP